MIGSKNKFATFLVCLQPRAPVSRHPLLSCRQFFRLPNTLPSQLAIPQRPAKNPYQAPYLLPCPAKGQVDFRAPSQQPGRVECQASCQLPYRLISLHNRKEIPLTQAIFLRHFLGQAICRAGTRRRHPLFTLQGYRAHYRILIRLVTPAPCQAFNRVLEPSKPRPTQ